MSIFTAMPVVSHAANRGSCGESVNYSYNTSTKKLTISGTGAMDDFTYTDPGWYDYRTDTLSIEVCSGVTAIGTYAFRGCENVIDLADTCFAGISFSSHHFALS